MLRTARSVDRAVDERNDGQYDDPAVCDHGVVDTLATHLHWAQRIGTPADHTAVTAIDQARRLADTNPEVTDHTNRQQTRDLLVRAGTLTRTYTQRLSHRSTERTQDRDTGLEL
jgi:hypothetical protein